MKYTLIAPPLHLKDWVQCFWSLESGQDDFAPKEYFLMADGCAEIIFQYNGGFQAFPKQSARFRIQHSESKRFLVGKELGFFGARLFPHAVCQMIGSPASELINLVFDFSYFFRQEGEDLADQIFSATDTGARVSLLSDFLSKNIPDKKVDPIKNLVRQVIEQDGRADISSLQEKSGLSLKQFERRFKSVAGFSPKYFSRIIRFQSTRLSYRSNRIGSLTHFAYSCDYYDQSHFIREFKEFSGLLPLQYFKWVEIKKTDHMPFMNSSTFGKGGMHDGCLPCGFFV